MIAQGPLCFLFAICGQVVGGDKGSGRPHEDQSLAGVGRKGPLSTARLIHLGAVEAPKGRAQIQARDEGVWFSISG